MTFLVRRVMAASEANKSNREFYIKNCLFDNLTR
jgi:hypothetical protein